jgi:hypothetical protein
MKITSMRGQSVDMARLIAQNSHKVALGNAHMNARGDLIGKDGLVTVMREDIARDYHKSNPKAVHQMPLRSINKEVVAFDTPAQALAKQKEIMLQQADKVLKSVGKKPKRLSDD